MNARSTALPIPGALAFVTENRWQLNILPPTGCETSLPPPPRMRIQGKGAETLGGEGGGREERKKELRVKTWFSSNENKGWRGKKEEKVDSQSLPVEIQLGDKEKTLGRHCCSTRHQHQCYFSLFLHIPELYTQFYVLCLLMERSIILTNSDCHQIICRPHRPVMYHSIYFLKILFVS